jgi:hypothetical protein
MVIKTVLLDDPLNLPGRDGFAVLGFIEFPELHLAIADVSSPEVEDAEFLDTGHFPVPRMR